MGNINFPEKKDLSKLVAGVVELVSSDARFSNRAVWPVSETKAMVPCPGVVDCTGQGLTHSFTKTSKSLRAASILVFLDPSMRVIQIARLFRFPVAVSVRLYGRTRSTPGLAHFAELSDRVGLPRLLNRELRVSPDKSRSRHQLRCTRNTTEGPRYPSLQQS